MASSGWLAGGQASGSKYALMWPWPGRGGTLNGHGDFDPIGANRTP